MAKGEGLGVVAETPGDENAGNEVGEADVQVAVDLALVGVERGGAIAVPDRGGVVVVGGGVPIDSVEQPTSRTAPRAPNAAP